MNIPGFLLEDEWYASTDISKHLEEFFWRIFTWVVVQKCLLDQIGKVGVEPKISNDQKMFLHEGDVETLHDIPKFWWNF